MAATLCLIVTTPLPIQYLWKITSSKIAKAVISRFVSLQISGECSCAAQTAVLNSIPISNSVRKSLEGEIAKKSPPVKSPPKGPRRLLKLLCNLFSFTVQRIAGFALRCNALVGARALSRTDEFFVVQKMELETFDVEKPRIGTRPIPSKLSEIIRLL